MQRTKPRSTASAAQQAAVVVAVGVSAALHIGKLPVSIPRLQEAMGLTLIQAGFMLSLVQLAGMGLGLLAGLLADRIGPRRVMLAGLLLLSVSSAAGSGASGASMLLAVRGLEGLGFLLSVLPAPALMRQSIRQPATLTRALGWWGAYMPAGTAVALLLGAPLLDVLDWTGLWLVLGGVTACSTVLLWWIVAADPPVSGRAPERFWPRLTRTLAAPQVWLLGLGFFCYSGQWLAVVGFLPTIYGQAGVGGFALGAITALAACINILGNVGAGRLLSRGVRPGTVLSVGYGVMGVGAWVAFGASGSPVLQYLAVLAFSGFGGLVPGTLFGLAVPLAPDRRAISTTVGWMQQWSAMGQFVGPPLVAWFATRLSGWQGTWILTGVASVAGICLAWWLQRAWELRQMGVAED